ncbi:unnamed protein product, partial [Ectocarpus sp. 8 AP-2014]
VACGTIVHNDKTQVASGNTQSNSRFVYDQQSQDTTEVSRNATVLDASGQSAHVELSTLVTVDGERSMQPVIKSSPTSTTFSSLRGGLVANLTIDGSISWDRDESCLYFAANRAFRFKYIESNGISPSMLVLEGLNPTTLQYTPKFEISSD